MLQLHRILEKAECLKSFIRLRLPNGSAKNKCFLLHTYSSWQSYKDLCHNWALEELLFLKEVDRKLSMIYSPAKIYVIIVFKVELVFCNKVLLQVQKFELESLIYYFFY